VDEEKLELWEIKQYGDRCVIIGLRTVDIDA
jgi:hypothetical protein